jgi:Short C-terminal domain
MAIGRMLVWSWILFVLFIFAAVAGGSLGSIPLVVAFVVGSIAAFVYGMYLSLRVMRHGDPRLLRRGIRGTALILAAKQTNTVVQEGDFAWQAPYIWKYHLRISLPGREPYETDCSICAADLQVGSTVNVAVAPHNHKRVTIDVGQAQVKGRRAAAKAKAASTEDSLRDLAERRERGELTDSDFEAQKSQLLGS